jgi:hypothetical protein
VARGAGVGGGGGGGTVYCIKLLAVRSPEPPADLDSWENIGHVTGSGLAAVVVLVLPLGTVFALAAMFAAMTAVAAMAIERAHASATS